MRSTNQSGERQKGSIYRRSRPGPTIIQKLKIPWRGGEESNPAEVQKHKRGEDRNPVEVQEHKTNEANPDDTSTQSKRCGDLAIPREAN